MRFFAVLFFAIYAHAQLILPPHFNSEEEKAIFLGHLARHIPEMFQQGTEYDIDYFKLLNEQQTIIMDLQTNRNFVSQAKRREPLVELRFFQGEEARQEDVRSEIRDLFLSKKSSSVLDLALELRPVAISSVLTGLVSILPSADKRRIIKQTDHEKLKYLRENFQIVSINFSNFSFQRLKFQPRSLEQVFDYVERQWDIQESLTLKLEEKFVSVLRSKVKSSELSKSQAESLVKSYVDFQLEDAKKLLSQDRIKQIAKIVFDRIENKFEWRRSEDSLAFTLKEVPAYLASLRGIVGMDCSTQFSFPYGLLPNERTFFIYNSSHQMLGYVSLTVLKVNGKKALYLHDISGYRISPEMSHLVVLGLFQALGDLKVEKLILPTESVSNRNLNFNDIRVSIDNIAAKGTPVSLVYEDITVRDFLSQLTWTHVNHNFDQPAANQQGIEVDLSGQGAVRVQAVPAVYESFSLSKLNPQELFLLALNIDFPYRSGLAKHELKRSKENSLSQETINLAARRAAASKILGVAQISEDMETLDQLLNNFSSLPLEDYLDQVKTLVSRHGISWPEFLEKHRYLLQDGILRSPNLTTTSPEKFQKYVIPILLQGIRMWAFPDSFYSVIERDPKLFADDPEFRSFLRGLLRDDAESLKKFVELCGRVGVKVLAFKEAINRFLQKRTRNVSPELTRSLEDLVQQWDDTRGGSCSAVVRGNRP